MIPYADRGGLISLYAILSRIDENFYEIEDKYNFSSANLDATGYVSMAFAGDRYWCLDDCCSARSLYRKSMEKGFIYGAYRFAVLMYRQKYYSIALKHYLKVLEHPHWNRLTQYIRGMVLNDISLCHYFGTFCYDSFWKYNEMSRETLMPIAFNNAGNCYFRGTGLECIDLDNAEKMFLEAIKLFSKDSKKTIKAVEYCSKMLGDIHKLKTQCEKETEK